MLSFLNQLFAPAEQSIRKYQKYIGYFFIFLSITSLILIWYPNSVKFTGEQSLNLLWFLLFLPIFAKVFGISLARAMMPLRKEIGILMGMLALVHGIAYVFPDPTYIVSRDFWVDDGYLSAYGWGAIALTCTFPLLLTSNTWSMQLLGKKWKILHRLVYIVIIFTIIHIVALKWSRHFELGGVILMGIYFFGKILEWKGISFTPKKIYQKGQKWLCVPCGYIYDPIFGDEDSGIAPGTEFTDIPNDWRCQVCGVSKSDFVPLDEKNITRKKYTGRVIQKKYLNPTTVELIIELNEVIKSIPGQFVSFIWEDAGGEFTRAYSIVHHEGKRFTFLIKQNPNGRGAHIIDGISNNANICISGVFGNFTMQETQNPKIFIATGTGLAPIYNMLTHIPSEIKKTLYFSVATHDELFYKKELESIKNLNLNIHITRENITGLETGRVNIDTIEASLDTEWHLCGNPKMVSETKQKLFERGYKKIYSEEF